MSQIGFNRPATGRVEVPAPPLQDPYAPLIPITMEDLMRIGGTQGRTKKSFMDSTLIVSASLNIIAGAIICSMTFYGLVFVAVGALALGYELGRSK